MDSAAEPAFEDGEVAASFAVAREAVQAAVAAAARSLSTSDVLAAEQEWEHLNRLIGTAQIDNLATIDASRIHRIDGHRSVAAHTRHMLKVSPEEGGRRAQAARALRASPRWRPQPGRGKSGRATSGCWPGCTATLASRPRWSPPSTPSSTGPAPSRSTSSRPGSSAWERTVDLDGGHRDNDRNHDNRNVRLIHNSTVSDLERTDAQRRADALERIFNDGAGAPADTSRPAIVHSIVWSADAYLALADLLGADAAALDTHWSASLTDPTARRGQWCDPATYRCSTLDGVPLEPVEQFFSSLANEVRRVIVNAKGVVIDLGRKARLFTGSARQAAQLHSPRCIWPGCDVPTTRCEIDHLHDHAKGGPTNAGNGAPLCGFHNRWKQKGFATTRDPVTGRWRTYRPDGTLIR